MDILIPEQNVEHRIYRIRGKQVMLDSDLAALYEVPAFRLNEQVRRNLRRFPPDFMFQLSSFELDSLTSQIAMLKKPGRGRHKKYAPLAFTEQGIAMLSGILRSQKAIDVNIAIMRAFIKLRRALLGSRDIVHRVEKLEGKINIHETDICFLKEDIRGLRQKAISPPSIRVKGFEEKYD